MTHSSNNSNTTKSRRGSKKTQLDNNANHPTISQTTGGKLNTSQQAGTQGRTKVEKETIESVYNNYCNHEYMINRRYQRKLVWQTKEKQALVDTILNNFPLPQFLFAEITIEETRRTEIIDGLQRMSAIVGYIENEYACAGKFFDLNVISEGKSRVERGILQQREPRLDPGICRKFLQYTLGITTYESNDESKIEEVFRRINSTGQKLSAQDLRQAGATTPIAELVRRISSDWRGDNTRTRIDFQDVKAISINDDTNSKGINIDDLFLVQHGIVSRQEIRSSADEQIALDLVSDMLFNEPFISTSTPVRDYLYGRETDTKPSKIAQEQIDKELNNRGWDSGERVEEFRTRFNETLDRVEDILSSLSSIEERMDFRKACGTDKSNPVPRYFEALFSTVYKFLYCEGRDLSDGVSAARALVRARLNEHMKSGGDWNPKSKAEITNHLRTEMDHCFDTRFDSDSSTASSLDLSRSALMTLLTGTLAESDRREFKQGFLSITANKSQRKFNDKSFDKILRTLTAISNSNPTECGSIIIGIADDQTTAQQIALVDKITPIEYRTFQIVGIDREVTALGHQSLDRYIDQISQKIRDCSKIHESYRCDIVRHMRVARHKGLTLLILFSPAVSRPVSFDGQLFQRVGSSTVPIPADQQFDFMLQFREKTDAANTDVTI